MKENEVLKPMFKLLEGGFPVVILMSLRYIKYLSTQ